MRLFTSSLLGVAVAIALFLLMNRLISGDPSVDRNREQALRLDFIQVDQDELENIRERRKPPKPEPPKEPPPPPKLEIQNQDRPQQDMPRIDMPRINAGLAAGAGPYLGSWSAGDPTAEGDVIPLRDRLKQSAVRFGLGAVSAKTIAWGSTALAQTRSKPRHE